MRYFKESEFHCNCGKCGFGYHDMDEDFTKRLDRARGYAGVPFVLTSTIRCMKYNCSGAVGSDETSSHPKGEAADIACDSSYERYRIIRGLVKAGFARIGIGPNFVHVDSDSDKPKELIWRY